MKSIFITKGKFLPFNVLLILIVLSMTGCSPPPGAEDHIKKVTTLIDDDYLVHADQTPENWVSYGRNYAEDRFSSLSEINKENIGRLGLAWSLNLETTRGIEATPLVVDGIMFLSGPWSKVFAINTRTGKLIWRYDPGVPGKYGEKVCCDVVNRGLAIYKGRVFVGTLDGRLISLDASNGKPVWEILTVDTTKYYTITGAPRVVDGKVIIGNGGAEYGVRGYITAYDALSGEQEWRFYTVPGDPSKPFESKAMEVAAKTWAGEWWKYGGGGTAWDAMAYDPALRLLYIGTGNGSPWNWFHRSNGSGDNLFLSSILALNPDNGELVWYYQTTPGDDWDYTATQHMILADLEIGGKPKKVIMQAPKNGFFYLLDRTNGELLSAKPYTYMNWASSVDLKTGRPIEADFSRYKNENVVISPGILGGHNWQPMAYNPLTKLVYIPTHHSTSTYGHDPNWKFVANTFNSAAEINSRNPTRADKSSPETMNQGRLIAWDPVKQEEVWGVNHTPTYWNGGVLTTAGELVFQGTSDGRLVAYDARGGGKLWEYSVGSGVIAPPVTYTVDGKQYVSLAVGWGGAIGQRSKFTRENYPGTVFTFALDSNKAHSGFYESKPKQLIRVDFSASSDEINNGSALFARHCTKCHMPLGKGGSIFPDLVYSSEGIFANFESIVLKGTLLKNGMPDFSDRLNANEVSAIKNYILYSANELGEKGNK